jgi:hypothetical protein
MTRELEEYSNLKKSHYIEADREKNITIPNFNLVSIIDSPVDVDSPEFAAKLKANNDRMSLSADSPLTVQVEAMGRKVWRRPQGNAQDNADNAFANQAAAYNQNSKGQANYFYGNRNQPYGGNRRQGARGGFQNQSQQFQRRQNSPSTYNDWDNDGQYSQNMYQGGYQVPQPTRGQFRGARGNRGGRGGNRGERGGRGRQNINRQPSVLPMHPTHQVPPAHFRPSDADLAAASTSGNASPATITAAEYAKYKKVMALFQQK